MSNCNEHMHEHVSINLGYRYCPDCGMQLLADCESSSLDTDTEKLTGFKAIISKELHKAEMEYEAARNAYYESLWECRISSYERNQASYWKGRRDALRVFLKDNKENQS